MRDTDLLLDYLQSGSESAFTELVNRYIDLAYSVARRHLSDQNLAEEAVQSVFCLLARKASGLTRYESLAGWVHRAAYNISLRMYRDERKRRERQDAIAEEQRQQSASSLELAWEHLVPMLDEALHQLSDSDRSVLVLRFVQQKGMREVGAALGTTEAAAKMRVGRAIEKVRGFLKKRGLVCTTATVAGAMSAMTVRAAPVGLSTHVALSALAGTATKSIAELSLAKLLLFMAQLNSKTVLVGLGLAAFLGGGAVLFHYSVSQSSTRSIEQAQSQATPVIPRSTNLGGIAAFRERLSNKLHEAGLARARAHLQSALKVPPRKGTRSYPSRAVEDALAEFGSELEPAFDLVQAALQNGSEEEKLQAVAALGRIGKKVPEAKSLLWQIVKEGEDTLKSTALSALNNTNLVPDDIPKLAALIPGQTNSSLVRYLPETIARAIQRNPETAKAYFGSVEALLQNDDPNVRFGGACALAAVRGSQDPAIIKSIAEGLSISERYRRYNEATGEVVRHLMAVETLAQMGAAAKAALPELQAFAAKTPDGVIREVALRAIGTIDAAAGSSQPEVRAVLLQDEQRNSLIDRLQNGSFTSDDLTQGLREPMTASMAAAHVAEQGPAAKALLPIMQQALAGKDEATRDEIIVAMKTIDPDYSVERVPRAPVDQGTLAALLELETQRAQGQLDAKAADALQKLLEPMRMGNTSWYTQSELAEFRQQLQKASPQIWNVFLVKASAADPSFETGLARTGK